MKTFQVVVPAYAAKLMGVLALGLALPAIGLGVLGPMVWPAQTWQGRSGLPLAELLPLGSADYFTTAAPAVVVAAIFAFLYGSLSGQRRLCFRVTLVLLAIAGYLLVLGSDLPHAMARMVLAGTALSFILSSRLVKRLKPIKTVLFFIGVSFTIEAMLWSFVDPASTILAFASFGITAAVFTRIDRKRAAKTACLSFAAVLVFATALMTHLGAPAESTGLIVVVLSALGALLSNRIPRVIPEPFVVVSIGGGVAALMLTFTSTSAFIATATVIAVTYSVMRRRPIMYFGRVKGRTQTFDSSPVGLTDMVFPHIEFLGRRGSRIVYHAPELEIVMNPATRLLEFSIDAVFKDTGSILIGCGKPNLATTVFDDSDGRWKRLSAFMLFRAKSDLTSLDQLQSGVYFELRNLGPEVRSRLVGSMAQHSGVRAISCAHLNAKVLTEAGFTLGGGREMSGVVFPSQLASRIWHLGLEHEGRPVDIRVVNTGAIEVGDHFMKVWGKEVSSPLRMIHKALARKKTPAVPLAPAALEVAARSGDVWSGRPLDITVNRPGVFGWVLSLIWGRHAEYRVQVPGMGPSPELSTPLVPFPGPLSRVSQAKKFVLFSRPVVWFINFIKNQSFERYNGVPIDAALEMLSPCSEVSGKRALWNFALVLVNDSYEIRLSPLKNLDPLSNESRLRRVSNWILAKHVVATGYHPATMYAGEAWVQRTTDGRLVLSVNDNSGTYKPRAQDLEAVGALFGGLGINVRCVPFAHEAISQTSTIVNPPAAETLEVA